MGNEDTVDREDGLKGHSGKPDGGPASAARATGEPSAGDGERLRETLYGDHMSGRYGTPAYGRIDGSPPGALADPSQQPPEGDVSAASLNPDAGQNAQISGAAGYQPMSAARQDERDMPGISTDKHSDDTKPE